MTSPNISCSLAGMRLLAATSRQASRARTTSRMIDRASFSPSRNSPATSRRASTSSSGLTEPPILVTRPRPISGLGFTSKTGLSVHPPGARRKPWLRSRRRVVDGHVEDDDGSLVQVSFWFAPCSGWLRRSRGSRPSSPSRRSSTVIALMYPTRTPLSRRIKPMLAAAPLRFPSSVSRSPRSVNARTSQNPTPLLPRHHVPFVVGGGESFAISSAPSSPCTNASGRAPPSRPGPRIQQCFNRRHVLAVPSDSVLLSSKFRATR